MDSSRAGSLFLRGTSAISLHERFSEVSVDQLTRSRTVTLGADLPLQRGVSYPPPVVLLVKKQQSSLLSLQAPDMSLRVRQLRRRRSVWSRLGWQGATHHLASPRTRGFWGFRGKYCWRARVSSAYRRRGRRRFLRTTGIRKLTAGPHLSLDPPGGGAAASRGRGPSKDDVPTKRALDAQLDDYMSLSKRRLDAQLEDYMSTSRNRLDAQLDENMSLAGETRLQWD